MYRTRVPPATIHEHGQAGTRQHEVGRASIGEPAMETKSSALSMQGTTQKKLGRRINFPAPA